MKTVCTSIAVALLLSLTPAFLTAGTIDNPGDPGELIMNVKVFEDAKFSLQLANLQGETAYISLEDFYGSTYMSKVVKDHNGYRVNINLENAPHGRFMLKVRTDGKVYSRIVYYNDEQLLFSHLTES